MIYTNILQSSSSVKRITSVFTFPSPNWFRISFYALSDISKCVIRYELFCIYHWHSTGSAWNDHVQNLDHVDMCHKLQVMAYSLTALSHPLNQCRLLIGEFLWHLLKNNGLSKRGSRCWLDYQLLYLATGNHNYVTSPINAYENILFNSISWEVVVFGSRYYVKPKITMELK